MFPAAYFAPRYFAPHYFPEVGAAPAGPSGLPMNCILPLIGVG